jgi:hypothetical protein
VVVRRRFSTDERRARLVRRHHLGRTAPDVTSAVRDLVAFHSSDPSTPHLGAWARVSGFAPDDLHHALVEARTLWRMHAMRRTLFVVPAADAGIVEAAAGRDIARAERRRFEGWLATEMGSVSERGEGGAAGHRTGDGIEDWLDHVRARVLDALAGGAELRTQDLKGAVPELQTVITVGSGKWATRTPVASRVLFLLAMEGWIVRTRAAGSWRSSQYAWAATDAWFGTRPPRREPAAARAELTRRYLAAFGPATEVDLRWWTGWTAARARAALEAVGAVAVDLEGDGASGPVEGFVLPAHLVGEAGAAASEVAASVAFLPGLDPTSMGWKGRGWYLGDHTERVFDRNGNAGPTIWVGGRIVGGWGQRSDGEVANRLLEDVGDEATARVEAEAAALTAWLDGVVVTPRFRTPLERELTAD